MTPATRLRWHLWPGLFSLGCSAYGSGVDRIVDGELEHGRFVSHVSYAAYARAAELEARGEYAAAEASYRDALDFDAESPELWTRLGAVRCAGGMPAADAAFDTAENLAADYAPVWYERGRCNLGHGRAKRALSEARRALSLDPSHLPTSKLIIDAYSALGRREQAQRYLDALVAQHPDFPSVQRWQREFESPAAVTPKSESGRVVQRDGLELVDRALCDENSAEAERLALEHDVSPSELAARAVALGKPRVGFEQAGQVFAADPSDGGAWATLLAAADLLRDERAYEENLHATEAATTLPEGMSLLLFAELLKRRVGDEAALAWLRAAPRTEADDALLAEHEARLERELAGTQVPVDPPLQTEPPPSK